MASEHDVAAVQKRLNEMVQNNTPGLLAGGKTEFVEELFGRVKIPAGLDKEDGWGTCIWGLQTSSPRLYLFKGPMLPNI